ncbi:MAG TPA: metal-dependent transcriptional regulator [Acidobacteriota bacterium]|nr:metal-dependent transcriptional regulator [Acidobacteriota bacterium]HNT16412.1 metal-dependent transcriptional regulator [Acidobacteriota bacterium]
MPGRSEYLGESLEDYAEAILELEGKEGSARVTDISKKLAVSKPSVTGALAHLKEKGIVEYAPYSYIRLTDKGRALAKKVRRRHEVLSGFLTDILGISPEKANVQACRMEHILEPETIEKMCKLASFMKRSYANPSAKIDSEPSSKPPKSAGRGGGR